MVAIMLDKINYNKVSKYANVLFSRNSIPQPKTCRIALKEIISIKTYSPIHEKIVSTFSHNNTIVWVQILYTVKKFPIRPVAGYF